MYGMVFSLDRLIQVLRIEAYTKSPIFFMSNNQGVNPVCWLYYSCNDVLALHLNIVGIVVCLSNIWALYGAHGPPEALWGPV